MTKTKQKLKAVGKPVNKDKIKMMLSFRVDIETHKQLSQIAQRKKASKTRVISELIRLAHIGLYSKPSKVLNEFYNDVIDKWNKEFFEKNKQLIKKDKK